MIVINNNSKSVQHLTKQDKRLARVISMIGEITYTPYDDGYAFLVHEIIEQMLSQKAAQKIYSRLVEKCNGNILPEIVSQLSESDFRDIGTSSSKAIYIRALTESILNKELVLSNLIDKNDDEIIKSLTSIRGIGTWTSKMYLIFVLDRQDILPYEDSAFLQSYKWLYKTNAISVNDIKKRCKKWKPYSSVAARYMYKALDMGLTKTEFHLYRG